LRFGLELARGHTVLSARAGELMQTREAGDYGLGLGLAGEGDARRFMHGGSNEGFRCLLIVYPARGQGAAIMTNGDNGELLIDEVERSLAAEYKWPGIPPVIVRTEAKLAPEALARLAGVYTLAGGEVVTARVVGGRLEFLVNDESMGIFLAASEHELFSLEQPLTITVDGDELVFHVQGTTQVGKRKR
jgi:hypothetical protein